MRLNSGEKELIGEGVTPHLELEEKKTARGKNTETRFWKGNTSKRRKDPKEVEVSQMGPRKGRGLKQKETLEERGRHYGSSWGGNLRGGQRKKKTGSESRG